MQKSYKEKSEKKCRKTKANHLWTVSINKDYEICQECGCVKKNY